MELKLEEGQVSQMEDKIHILNAIAGNADLNAAPPQRHPHFDKANNRLRWRFALAAFEQETDHISLLSRLLNLLP